MKKNILRVLAGTSILIILAFSANPPNGRTGAPGDGLCSGCHSSTAQTGSVMINNLPATITPGQTYTIEVLSTTTSSSALAGFQMVALHDDGNINAGTMANPSSGSTVTPFNSRIYHEHNPAQPFIGNTVSWTVDWTAPLSGPSGDITFYAASVLANGNNQNNGDGVVQTNVSGDYTPLPPLTAGASLISGVTCNGDNDGSAMVTASGGTMPYSYEWSSGETDATAVMLEGGMQSVTVTDDASQMVVETINIPEPDLLAANAVVDNQVSCFGFGDGQASANATGGTATYSYEWSDGQMGNVASNLNPGTYDVTVTDMSGCTSVETVEITEPSALNADIVSQTDISCFGFDDGSATAAADGGTMPYSYLWSDGQTGNVASNLTPGLHMVTVTDANSCDATEQVIISEPDELVATVAGHINVTCFGGADGSASASVIGGTPTYSFLWSDGQTGATATSLSAGMYTCTITDMNDCQDMITVNITEPSEIIVALTIENESMPGAGDGSVEADVTGGISPYTYNWSNGEMGPVIENLSPGEYFLTVTDDHGCTVRDTAIVAGSGCDLTVSIQVIDTLDCPNGMNASLTYVTNDPVIMVDWSTGSSADTLSGLGANTYSITVTDAGGCQATDTITLSASDTAAPVFITDTLCLFIDNNGMALLDSQQFYSNLIDDCDPEPSTVFMNIPVDCSDTGILSEDYTLRDAAGNVRTSTLYIIVSDTTRPFITCPPDVTINSCGSINYTLPVGMDNCDSVRIELVSGRGSGSSFPVGTTTETYRAVDVAGNQSLCSFNITVESDLAVNVMTTDATCADSSNGTALISGSGGVSPYTFEVLPAVDLSMIPEGTYQVTLNDSAGCEVVDTFEIMAPPPILLDTAIVTDATTGNFDGSIEVTVSGGVMPYSYLWFRDTSMYSTNEDIFNLFAGYYSLEVTDDNGCIAAFDSIQVDEISNTRDMVDLSGQILIYEHESILHVKPKDLFGVYHLELYNASGQSIGRFTDLNGEFIHNLKDQTGGLILARILRVDGGTLTKTFVSGFK